MKKKALCVIGLLLLAGCGNSEVTTTTAPTSTTEKKTETASEKVTEKATEKAKMTEREAKNQDITNAAMIVTAFNHTLTDEEAFDEFYPMIAQGGFAIQPFEDGSFVYIFPDGMKSTKIESMMNDAMKDVNPYFNYITSDWETLIWSLNVDNDFKPYICVYTSSKEFVELYPNIDKRYN